MLRNSLSFKYSELWDNAIIFILAFYPPLPLFNYLNPLLLFYYLFRYKSSFNFSLSTFVILTSLALSFIYNTFSNPSSINGQSISRVIMIALILSFFPFCRIKKISKIFIIASILYIFLSQVAYYFNWNDLVSFYDTYYPYEGDIKSYTSDYLKEQSVLLGDNTRLGGLFHNPNHCARLYTLLLAVYLISTPNGTKLFEKFLIILAILFGVVLTGSRTGLFISFLLLLLSFFQFNIVGVSRIGKVVLFTVFIMLLYYFFTNIVDDSSYRALRITEGTSDSLMAKFLRFSDYIEIEKNTPALLFGHFDQHSFLTTISIGDNRTLDSEWGYAIFNYGFFFLIGYIIFFIEKIKKMNSNNMLILVPLFWVLTSAILLSYRFSLLYFLFFSHFYQKSLISNDNEL